MSRTRLDLVWVAARDLFGLALQPAGLVDELLEPLARLPEVAPGAVGRRLISADRFAGVDDARAQLAERFQRLVDGLRAKL